MTWRRNRGGSVRCGFTTHGNIIELGESIPCFCRRLHAQGLDAAAVAKKTGVDPALAEAYLQPEIKN
jgi:hypothetical protein